MPPRFGVGASLCARAADDNPIVASAADPPTNSRREMPLRDFLIQNPPDCYERLFSAASNPGVAPANGAALRADPLAGTTLYHTDPSIRLKPQHCLGQNVVLHFAGAAVNRDLAVVEISRSREPRPVRRDVVDVVLGLER